MIVRYIVASVLISLVMFMIGAIILKTYYLIYTATTNPRPYYEPRDWFDTTTDEPVTDEEAVKMFSKIDIEILDRFFEEWE